MSKGCGVVWEINDEVWRGMREQRVWRGMGDNG